MTSITITVKNRANKTYGIIVKHELTINGTTESWLDTFVCSGIRMAEKEVSRLFCELIGANINVSVIWRID